MGVVVGRIADAPGDGLVRPLVGRIEDEVPLAVDDLDGHDSDVERDARNARRVVGRLPDRARDVRAMAIQIERQLIVPDEVARSDEAVGRTKVRCLPDWDVDRSETRKVDPLEPERTRVVAEHSAPIRHAGIEDGHDRARRAAGVDIPGALQVYRRQIPLRRVSRIVRPETCSHTVGCLRVHDIVTTREPTGNGLRILLVCNSQHGEVGMIRSLHPPSRNAVPCQIAQRRFAARPPSHEHPTRDVGHVIALHASRSGTGLCTESAIDALKRREVGHERLDRTVGLLTGGGHHPKPHEKGCSHTTLGKEHRRIAPTSYRTRQAGTSILCEVRRAAPGALAQSARNQAQRGISGKPRPSKPRLTACAGRKSR